MAAVLIRLLFGGADPHTVFNLITPGHASGHASGHAPGDPPAAIRPS